MRGLPLLISFLRDTTTMTRGWAYKVRSSTYYFPHFRTTRRAHHQHNESGCTRYACIISVFAVSTDNPPFQHHEEGIHPLSLSGTSPLPLSCTKHETDRSETSPPPSPHPHPHLTTPLSHEREGGSAAGAVNICTSFPPSFSFLSTRREGVSPFSLCFLFVFNGEEGFDPPRCVFCYFSTARRVLTLLVVFSVSFQQLGGPKPSSPCFLFVSDRENRYNPPRHFI
jgi:hypothetical protein